MKHGNQSSKLIIKSNGTFFFFSFEALSFYFHESSIIGCQGKKKQIEAATPKSLSKSVVPLFPFGENGKGSWDEIGEKGFVVWFVA